MYVKNIHLEPGMDIKYMDGTYRFKNVTVMNYYVLQKSVVCQTLDYFLIGPDLFGHHHIISVSDRVADVVMSSM